MIAENQTTLDFSCHIRTSVPPSQPSKYRHVSAGSAPPSLASPTDASRRKQTQADAMSASLPGAPNGAPNGTPAKPPKQKANPLMKPMRPQGKRVNPLFPRRPPPPPKPAGTASNSAAPPRPGADPLDVEAQRRRNGGWSTEAPPGAKEYPVWTTKRALREGARYHVMRLVRTKLAEEGPVDPTDKDAFTRPVTLHRRDPAQPPPGRHLVKEEDAARESTPEDEKEAEMRAQQRVEREVERQKDLAKIAPDAREPMAPKKVSKKKKKGPDEEIFLNRVPKTVQDKKEADIRYEEALPWHLEDVDGKNVWVANYVSALSDSNPSIANVAFVIDRPGFRMIPLEKWYKFTSKPPFVPYSIDEAEKIMSGTDNVGRWIMKDKAKQAAQDELASTRTFIHGKTRIKTESSTFRGSGRAEKMEHDDIDMSGDEFQDDDENPGFENVDNEDEKSSKERIRREQLGANLFGDADENAVEKEMEAEMREEEERRKLGKHMKKALIKRERETLYMSDSDDKNSLFSSVRTPSYYSIPTVF